MKKIFLIDNDLNGFFPPQKEDLNIYEIANPPGSQYINMDYVNELPNVDRVIIFDSTYYNQVVQFILSQFPKIKIDIYYWNAMYGSGMPFNYIDQRTNNIWTFNPWDAKRFNLKYNSQFYFKSNLTRWGNIQKNNWPDLFFIGGDKDRHQKLKHIKDLLVNTDIKTYFDLCPWNGTKKFDDFPSKRMNYPSIINYIEHCKAIVDLIGHPTQEGLSLRPLEALFFKKKLITDNRAIKKTKLYNPNNIFVLGEDPLAYLSEFIKSPYQLPSNYEEILNYYSFEEWSKRFD